MTQWINQNGEPMRSLALLTLLGLVLTMQPLTAQTPASADLDGYSPADSQAELQWETKFKVIPVAANIRDYDKYLSAYPHNAGTPRDEQNAEWILAKLKQWGWNANVETFYVLLPSPKERLVEMIAPTTFKAKLEEPAVAVDPTSDQQNEQLPTYNMYSADGDVTAPLG